MKAWANNFMKHSKGFTIIELLIVLVVIGVLAALLFVGYGAVQNNAQDTAFKTELGKISDEIKLITLDNDSVPAGGATSALAGDSTRVSGVKITPNKDSYDLTTNNLFYCAGDLDGTEGFALVAKSKRGVIFVHKSNGTISELPSTTSMVYSSLCPAAGFSDPYTWAYGYNPSPQYGWFPWANGAAATIANIGTNPRNASVLWSNNNTITWNTSAVTVDDNPSGITTAVESRLKVGQTSTSVLSLYNIDGLLNSSTSRSVGVWAYVSDPNYEAYFTGPSETTHVSLEPGTWTYVKSSTALTGQIGFYITKKSGTGDADLADYAYATGSMTVAGDQAYDYRDGDSVGWTWSGTAGASTSSGPSPN